MDIFPTNSIMFRYIFYQLNNSYSITIKYLETRSSLCLIVVVPSVLIIKKKGCLIGDIFVAYHVETIGPNGQIFFINISNINENKTQAYIPVSIFLLLRPLSPQPQSSPHPYSFMRCQGGEGGRRSSGGGGNKSSTQVISYDWQNVQVFNRFSVIHYRCMYIVIPYLVNVCSKVHILSQQMILLK